MQVLYKGRVMEKQQVTAEEFAQVKEHWKTIVMAVFNAEEKLVETGILYKGITFDEYLGAIAEEILLSTFKITE